MSENKNQPLSEEQIRLIQKQAEGLQYGTLNLVFQDGLLIQIARNEKLRIPARRPAEG